MGNVCSNIKNYDNKDTGSQNKGKKLSELLTLKHCNRQFNHEDRLLLNLPCSHNFCRDCISKVTDKVCFNCNVTYNCKPPRSLDFTLVLEEINEIKRNKSKTNEKVLEKNELLIKKLVKKDETRRKKNEVI